MKKLTMTMMAAAVCCGCAMNENRDAKAVKSERKVIKIDPAAKPIRDISKSTCSPIVGYAGSMEGEGFTKQLLVTDREATAYAWRKSGARFVRQWAAVDHWQLGPGAQLKDEMKEVKDEKTGKIKKVKTGRKYIANKDDICDIKDIFSFYKEYGIKASLTLENYSVYTNMETFAKSGAIEDVKRVIVDYVKWIKDNGFCCTVGAFELGNEPYAMQVAKAEWYAERWTPIVNAIKEVWPEAPIGIAIGEYFDNDPDVKAIRDRAMSANPLQRTGYFSAGEFNRWSARYLIAMSNCLHNIDHVIYHTYGAETPFSATYAGLQRYRNFNKAFEEQLKGKKMWITEWRDRSDEDNWSHQRFRETLNKTGYMLMMVAQPDIDGMNLHQFTSLSGAFHTAVPGAKNEDGTYGDGTWSCHWDGRCWWRTNFDDIHKAYLKPGMMGPAMRLMAETFRRDPVVMDFGSEKYGAFSEGCSNAVWSCSDYYNDFFLRFRPELRKGKKWNEIAPCGVDCEYLVTKSRSYISIIFVNYKNTESEFEVKVPQNYKLLPYEYRIYDCPEQFLDVHEVPGEQDYTRCYGYQTLNRHIFAREAGPCILTIPPNSVTAVRIPYDGRHLGLICSDLIERAVLWQDGKGGASFKVRDVKKNRNVCDGGWGKIADGTPGEVIVNEEKGLEAVFTCDFPGEAREALKKELLEAVGM